MSVKSAKRTKISSIAVAALLTTLAGPTSCAEMPLEPDRSLHVSEDDRYLTTADGDPFFYVGDAAWEMMHRLTRDEIELFLDARAAQGFNVVKSVILAERNSLRVPNKYGELPLIDMDPTQPNDAYFEHIDFVVDAAAERGIYMGLLPSWGDKVPNPVGGFGPIVFTPENANEFGRYLGHRYKDKEVIWFLGGDRNPDHENTIEIWRAMAAGIREGNGGRHLMTFHPPGGKSSSEWFHNDEWLDFNIYQSGHTHPFTKVYHYAINDTIRTPRKPVFNGEPAYEDVPYNFWTFLTLHEPMGGQIAPGVIAEDGFVLKPEAFPYGFISAYDTRVHAYWDLLSGAVGVAYGHNSIWQMAERGGDIGLPYLQEWKDALDAPGADDIRHIVRLNELKTFINFKRAQWTIEGPNEENERHIRAAISHDDTVLLAYLSQGQPVSFNHMPNTGEGITAIWFDPATGEAQRASASIERGTVFQPPSSGKTSDWLLILDSTGAYDPLLD